MNRLGLKTIATFAFAAITMLGADVTGKWTAEVEGRNGQKRTTVFNLKSEGEKLTGTVSGPGGRENNIEDGKISGDDISFSVTVEFNGNSRKVPYTGKISGDSLNLKMGEGDRARDVVAKRATS